MFDSRCPHMLCARSAYERDLADTECALDDCPFNPPPVTPAEIERRVRELTAKIIEIEKSA
jgi:hypothetical protein